MNESWISAGSPELTQRRKERKDGLLKLGVGGLAKGINFPQLVHSLRSWRLCARSFWVTWLRKMTENEVAAVIVDSAVKVHMALGPGLLEVVYENALGYELIDQKSTRL